MVHLRNVIHMDVYGMFLFGNFHCMKKSNFLQNYLYMTIKIITNLKYKIENSNIVKYNYNVIKRILKCNLSLWW